MEKKSVAVKKDAKQKKPGNLLEKIKACMTDAGLLIVKEMSEGTRADNEIERKQSVKLVVALQRTPRGDFHHFVKLVQEIMDKIGVHYKCEMMDEDKDKEGAEYRALHVTFKEAFVRVLQTTRMEKLIDIEVEDTLSGSKEYTLTRSIRVDIYPDILRVPSWRL